MIKGTLRKLKKFIIPGKILYVEMILTSFGDRVAANAVASYKKSMGIGPPLSTPLEEMNQDPPQKVELDAETAKDLARGQQERLVENMVRVLSVENRNMLNHVEAQIKDRSEEGMHYTMVSMSEEQYYNLAHILSQRGFRTFLLQGKRWRLFRKSRKFCYMEISWFEKNVGSVHGG